MGTVHGVGDSWETTGWSKAERGDGNGGWGVLGAH